MSTVVSPLQEYLSHHELNSIKHILLHRTKLFLKRHDFVFISRSLSRYGFSEAFQLSAET